MTDEEILMKNRDGCMLSLLKHSNEEKAKEKMMKYNGKCDYCEHKYPDCEKIPYPTDEEIIKIIMEVEL